ncbi:hypothetical protein C2R22_13810 [Salinigranum rubrum]|uniref:Uncharacterized protein n=1 Tax=Salinigranum rubrum TaxID=755307 RepID=A0A2I8VKX0_9EURY|nr:hypothetical protein C2R22_13810 [Salinigranum rubrum]
MAAISATAASALAVGYGINEITSTRSGPQNPPSGSNSETDSGSGSGSGSGVTTADPDALDLTDFGAAVDGETDDTPAFEEALDAVEPGGHSASRRAIS